MRRLALGPNRSHDRTQSRTRNDLRCYRRFERYGRLCGSDGCRFRKSTCRRGRSLNVNSGLLAPQARRHRTAAHHGGDCRRGTGRNCCRRRNSRWRSLCRRVNGNHRRLGFRRKRINAVAQYPLHADIHCLPNLTLFPRKRHRWGSFFVFLVV